MKTIPLVQLLILSLSLVVSATVQAQTPTGNDIFIGELSIKEGMLEVANLQNVTAREGYDNQPFFLPDGKSMLFTSEITSTDGSQTDAMQYDLQRGEITNLSGSKQSEYSPTLMPNKTHYSVIAVDTDGKQKLWSYPLHEGTKKELLPAVEPVGYHTWINDSEVMLFVLGEPHRLEQASIKTGKTKVIDTNIGASLFVIPGTEQVSYSRAILDKEQQPSAWELVAFDPSTKESTVLTHLPDNAYYYSWTPDGKAIAANQSNLLQWDRTLDNTDKWRRFADVSQQCPKGVSRLAVNPQQTKIALVCTE